MLLPKNVQFRFADAKWGEIRRSYSDVCAVLERGVGTESEAQRRYEDLMENKPPVLACMWNLITAMRDIDLPSGTPLTYFKQLIWEDQPDRNIFAPAQDRFYVYADKVLLTQVQVAYRCRAGHRLLQGPWAHALLEVIANASTGSLTDPIDVYMLRWIAGRRAGVPEFNPPYTIE
jgi:hypothetical protein